MRGVVKFYCRCGQAYCDQQCKKLDQLSHTHKFPQNDTTASHREHDDSSGAELGEKQRPGVVGLVNVGNTCYMNSALQCFLHNAFLKQFFLSPDTLQIVNTSNKLGTQGHLLRQLKSLFCQYYFTAKSYINPRSFKHTVSKFMPLFEGYAQHDAQEFFSQLLDKVHEDTNGIARKEYTENAERVSGEPEAKFARRSWAQFQKRNFSLITEQFYGQFRSLIECGVCGYQSLTFDPFQILSLSIPAIRSFELQLFFISRDLSKGICQVQVEMKSVAQFKDGSVGGVVEQVRRQLQKEKQVGQASVLKMYASDFHQHWQVYKDETQVHHLFHEEQKIGMLPFYQQPNRRYYFVQELNEHDERVLRGEGGVEVVVQFVSEEHARSRNGNSQHLVFYMERQQTVFDLYACIFRKVYPITNLAELIPNKQDRKKDQQYFRGLWEQIFQKAKNMIFFQVFFGDEPVLPGQHRSKTVDSFLAKNQ